MTQRTITFDDEQLVKIAKACAFNKRQWDAMFFDSGPYDVTTPTHALRSFVARVVDEVLLTAPQPPMVGDWDVAVSLLSGQIMSDCGRSANPSNEPGSDPLRDRISQRIEAAIQRRIRKAPKVEVEPVAWIFDELHPNPGLAPRKSTRNLSTFDPRCRPGLFSNVRPLYTHSDEAAIQARIDEAVRTERERLAEYFDGLRNNELVGHDVAQTIRVEDC